MKIQILYRNLPLILTTFFLSLTFYFLARSLNGYEQNLQHLISISNLALSAGLFSLGIPAISLLNKENNPASPSFWQIFAVSTNLSAVALSLLFIFWVTPNDYFGFESTPAKGAMIFLTILFLSIFSALSYLLQNHLYSPAKFFFEKWPLFFHFAACGISLALICILCLDLVSVHNKHYEVTVILTDFLKRLILAGAIGQIFLSLSKFLPLSKYKLYSITGLVGSTFFLMGFLSGKMDTREFLSFISQSSQWLGLSILWILSCNVLWMSWLSKSRLNLNTGMWIVHLLFLAILTILGVLSTSVAGVLTGSSIKSLSMTLILLAIPFLLKRALYTKSRKTSVLFHIASVLVICGIFICLTTIISISSFGGSLVLSGFNSFKPLLGIFVVGLFLVLMSLFVSLWDYISHKMI